MRSSTLAALLASFAAAVVPTVAAATPAASSAAPAAPAVAPFAGDASAAARAPTRGSAAGAPHVRIEGVAFPSSVDADGAPMRLAGAGLFRWKWFVKVYAAAWYVGEGADASDLAADVPRRLEVSYLVPIEGPGFGRAARELLRDAFPPEVLAPLEERMARLERAYVDVKPGDRYALTYLPGRGLELALNGRPLAVVEGADFARVYFAIWLGDRPIDRGLRAALLGDGARASR